MTAKYSNLKIFHFKDKVDSLPRANEKILAPLQIRIKPTNVCNHDCWYCAYKVDNLQLGKNMVERDVIPKEKMLEIVADCAEMGVKSITFSGGGEPFVYAHLLATVTALQKHGIKFASLTNGAQLKGEISEFFARHGTWLRISIDAWDGPSYAKARHVSEKEFDRVMENIKKFKAHQGPCSLGVSFIVGHDNASHIYDFASRVMDMGADSIKVSPTIVSNDGRENNAYHSQIFSTVRGEIARMKSQLESKSFEVFDAYHELDDKFAKDYTWCPYLQVVPVIGADLNVYPCHDKAYNLENGLLGSIKNMRFKDFWFSDKNIYYKINPARDCNHHCTVNKKNLMLLEYYETKDAHLEFV